MSVARRPWLAALLSLVAPGAGQLYCGRLARGLVLFGVSLAASAAFVLAAVLMRGDTGFALLVASPVVSLLVAVAATVDASRLARGGPADAPLHAYQRPSGYLLLVVTSIAASMLGGGYVNGHVLHAYMIPTTSMAPTLQPGDRLLANLLRYRLHPIERGDLVVFVDAETGDHYVKRVIALPGEQVEIRRDAVLIDGRPLGRTVDVGDGWRETAGARTYSITPGGRPLRATQVPAASYFLIGDHRVASKDSRVFGAVPRDRILGAVQYRFWPPGSEGGVGPLD